MAFDLQNFGIGLLTGWGTAYVLYRARHRIRAARESAGSQAARAQNYATRSADIRYINDLVALCQANHLAGHLVKLSEVLIEPRFVPAPQLADPDSNELVEDVYNIVPRAHDYPYLHAVYNIDTLSIDELSTGNRALALLGNPGSGRTTALMAIILYCLNQVDFTPPKDKVQQRLDAEDAKLDEKERAKRAKERLAIEQRVRERLAEEREKDEKDDKDKDAQKLLSSLFFRLMPVYVHLGDIINRLKQFGTDVDPAEPLVRALQAHVGRITASTIPLNVYKRLNKGEVLMLVDGYDDLPESERPKALVWLQNFLAQYNQNFLIVTGPARGYGQLTRLGLTPVFMRPWSDLDMQRAARHYAANWARLSSKKRRDAKKLDETLRERAQTNNRGLSPLQVTLKIWANYADDAELTGIEGWLRAYLARVIPPDQAIGTLLPQMAQIAALQLDEGYITPARLEALAIGGASAGTRSAKKTDTQEEAAADEKSDEKKAQETETASVQGRLLGMLRRSGLMTRYRGDRYQFRHASICAYLASLTLKDVSEQKLLEKSTQPAWSLAFNYAAAHTPLDAVVQARMMNSGDLLNTPLLDMARWLAHAKPDVAWRARLLKQIDTLLTAPNQYPLLRERAAAALAGTRDKDVLLLFRRAARNTNAHLRRLACLGMGVSGDPEAIKDLVPLMRDQDAGVRLCAGMALGAIGTEAALEQMVLAFTENNPPMQQAMAIAFAALPDEGYAILYDAISDPEESIRRAAIYGLQRVNTKWALVALYHAFLEDDRWQVRDAAQQAFTEMQYGRETKTAAYPPAEKIDWLAKWAASKGENLPPGEAAALMLARVLQEGEPNMRAIAATAMGQMGLAPLTRQLYNALRDRQDEVRVAAHKALADLQMQIGQPLPGAG